MPTQKGAETASQNDRNLKQTKDLQVYVDFVLMSIVSTARSSANQYAHLME